VERDGSVRFTLADGETVIVEDADVPELYEQLWRLAPKPGALSTAALIRATTTQSEIPRTAIELTAEQSVMLREAVAQLRTEG
jgi:hypothetical protein